MNMVSICIRWIKHALYEILYRFDLSYPSKIGGSFCVWCFFCKFIDALKVVSHSLSGGDVSHFAVEFSIQTRIVKDGNISRNYHNFLWYWFHNFYYQKYLDLIESCTFIDTTLVYKKTRYYSSSSWPTRIDVCKSKIVLRS